MKSKHILVIFLILILNVLLIPTKESQENIYVKVNSNDKIEITLKGEVSFPGVYVFYQGVTLRDLVSYAGGLTTRADDNINMNERITKSKTVIIPRLKEQVEEITTKININNASFNELLRINGVTEKIAANIVIYREANGKFTDIKELIKVKYIGDKTLEAIIPYIEI